MNSTRPIGNNLFVCFHDQDKQKPILTFENISPERLEHLNKQGYGVFETINEFFGGRRITENLSRLCAVYADLDISKDEDKMPEIKRDEQKEKLITAINSYCPATYYIITKNGVQPIWLIDEASTDAATQDIYRRVIEGIIKWTKQYGNKGDPVKDVVRVLRVPGYYHQKSEPFLVTRREGNGKTYTLDELKRYFWVEPQQQPTQESISESDNPIYRAIDDLDIKQVVIDVWKELKHDAYFDDKYGHLWVDGVDTATFVGREGNKNYIATTSSDYPARGNAITYIAQTLGVSNKAAFKWLIEKYNLNEKVLSETVGLDIEQRLKLLFSDPQTRKEAALKIAQHLVTKYFIRTIDGKKDRELYLYKEGVYVTGTNTLRKEVQNILGELATSHYKNEIVDKVKDLTLVERKVFEVDPRYINLKNGVLDLKTNELFEHDAKYLFTYQIPVIYNPNATCPTINQFLKDILSEPDIQIIQEWFGFSLYRHYFIKKALICVGERDTGKTTLLNLLTDFIGTSNIAGVSLQKLAGDKFSAAHMYQKHVNLYDDLSSKDIQDNGAFKMATGNGYIPGEFKFGDQFVFRNFAKLTYTCNKIPNVADTNDDAYFNRWIVIEFNRPVPEDKIDKHLLSKITTPDELSGLLNWALEGLHRIINNQSFNYAKDPDEIKVQMLRSGSTIANFAYDCLEKAENDDWISKEEMYRKFTDYANRNSLALVTMNKFGKQLPKYADYISDGKKSVFNPATNRNKQDTGWRNVKFKDYEE